MAKTTFFIASRTEQENYILQKKLESLEFEFADVKFVGVHLQGLPQSVDRLTTAILMNLNEWSPKEATFLKELRSHGYANPVLITAKSDTSTTLRELRATPGITFLPKPFETKELIGLVRKMLLARQISQQVHRRYLTAQDAEIEMGGVKLVTRLRNLSKGGAYLEFLTPLTMTIGEYVSVKLELKDLKRTYTFPAKVVWANKHGNRGLGIGVEFTGRGEIFRSTIGF